MNDKTLIRLARLAETYVGLSSLRDVDIGLLESGALSVAEEENIRSRLRQEDPVAAQSLLGSEPKWCLVRRSREWWLVASDQLETAAALIAAGSNKVRKLLHDEVALLAGGLRVSCQPAVAGTQRFAGDDLDRLPFDQTLGSGRIHISGALVPLEGGGARLEYVVRFDSAAFRAVSAAASFLGDEWGPESVNPGEARSWLLPAPSSKPAADTSLVLQLAWTGEGGARRTESIRLQARQL